MRMYMVRMGIRCTILRLCRTMRIRARVNIRKGVVGIRVDVRRERAVRA
jgi:hypothetical protein